MTYCHGRGGTCGFHSKGTCGCAARKGMLLLANFRPLARVSFLEILVDFSLGKAMLFGNFGQRNVKLR